MENLNKTRLALSVKDIGLLGLMTAACVVGRTMFQFIPNIQPMTSILIIIALYKGVFRGLLVAVLSVLATNLYMGMGVWTISQILSYSGIILLVALLSRSRLFRQHLLLQTLFAVFAGFLFGFLTACVDYQIYGLKAFLPYYLQGLSFDLLHGVGNGGFYLILAPLFSRLLAKFWPK